MSATVSSAVSFVETCGASRSRIQSSAVILGLIASAIAVRAIGFERPLTGTFATKNAVYAMIARNWATGRAPAWQPTIDLLDRDGNRAWHLMEWPAPAWVAAMGWRYLGGSLDAWGRGVSIAGSAVAVWLAYLLGRRWFGERAGLASACVMAFSPVGVVYGRAFMLEAPLAALTLGVVYAFDSWLLGGRRAMVVVAAAAFSVAVAMKIYMLVLLAPLAWAAWRRRGEKPIRRIEAAIVFAALMTPTVCWYAWVAQVSPTSGPAADFHPISRSAVHHFPHPALANTDYYGRVLRDLATVGLTPIGLALAVMGACDARFRRGRVFLAALLLLLVALPLKFIAANYYYLVLLPPLALAVGLGWQRAIERFSPRPAIQLAIVGCALLIAARYAVGPAYRTLDEDRGVAEAAASARTLTCRDEPIATLHGSTIDLLYYCDRMGWGLNVDDEHFERQLAIAVESGARHLVVADVDGALRRPVVTSILESLPIERRGDGWCIYRLEASTTDRSKSSSPKPSTVIAATDVAGRSLAECRPHPAPSTARR